MQILLFTGELTHLAFNSWEIFIGALPYLSFNGQQYFDSKYYKDTMLLSSVEALIRALHPHVGLFHFESRKEDAFTNNELLLH